MPLKTLFLTDPGLDGKSSLTNPANLSTSQRYCRIGVWVCLIMQFLLACDASRQLTPTHDEYWHLPIGLLIWKTGRFDCDVINPPLLRLWAALPLYLGGANLKTDAVHPLFGEIGDHFWVSNPEHRMLWFSLGRIMIALMNGATGWLLSSWARRWFGDLSALAVAMMWCCCPTILAHGSLVTHDASAAFGFVSGLYALVRWREQPSWRRAVVAGLCVGVAQMLKVTCILLFPLALVVWLVIPTQPTEGTDGRTTWKGWIGQGAVILAMVLLVMNVGYLGQQTCLPLRSLPFLSQRFQKLQQIPWLGSCPIPIPKYHILALDRVAQDLQNAHLVYLDGYWDPRGFRRYYVEAMTYKLPLGTLLLVALTFVMRWMVPLAATVTRRGFWSIERRRQIVLWTPILMLLVPASLGSNQFGIRYVLPTLPLLYLFASQAAEPLVARPWRVYQWIVLLALISLPASLRYHPHHLAYFNEWAGGPLAGPQFLVDSNLDWGQDLHGLAEYMRQQHLDKIGLAYFGTVHPHSLGIQYELPPGQFPKPGDYAISVNFLVGRPFIIRKPTATGLPPEPTFETTDTSFDVHTTFNDEYRYFRFFQPKARIGYSIYVFHFTDEDIQQYRRAVIKAQNM